MQVSACFSQDQNATKSFSWRKLQASRHDLEHEKAHGEKQFPLRTLPLARWLKFNFVGGIGIAVQFLSLFALKSIMHLDYLLATALAVEAAVVHNFLWHERFTWADRVRRNDERFLSPRTTGFLRFNLTTGAVSIAGNVVLMKLFAGFFHLNYLVANAIAIAVCSVANFVVSDRWVFGKVH
jgi:putative flippase GtrA